MLHSLRCLQTNGTKGCPKCFKSSMKPGFVWSRAISVGSAAPVRSLVRALSLTDMRQAGGLGDFEAAALHGATRRWGEAKGLKNPGVMLEAALRDLVAASAPRRQTLGAVAACCGGGSLTSVFGNASEGGTECLWICLISYTIYYRHHVHTVVAWIRSACLILSELNDTFLSIRELECLYKTGASSWKKLATIVWVKGNAHCVHRNPLSFTFTFLFLLLNLTSTWSQWEENQLQMEMRWPPRCQKGYVKLCYHM